MLAGAIKHRGELEQRLQRVCEATMRCADAWNDARCAVDAAEKALAEAEGNQSVRVAAKFLGEMVEGASVEEATEVLERARGECRRLSGARDTLRAEAERAERDLTWARMVVRGAVRDVLRAEAVDGLRTKLQEAHRTFAELSAAAAVVQAASFRPGDRQVWSTAPDEHTLAVPQAWREAIAALESDADAVLPQSVLPQSHHFP